MFGIGGGEILIIAVIAVVLFGTDDLPKNLRKFMKVWSDFRGATHDLQRGWLDVRDKVTRDILSEDSHNHTAAGGESESAQLESSHSSNEIVPSVEGLTENTIASVPESDSLPVPRKAEGALAQGESQAEQQSPDSDESRESVVSSVSSHSDKST